MILGVVCSLKNSIVIDETICFWRQNLTQSKTNSNASCVSAKFRYFSRSKVIWLSAAGIEQNIKLGKNCLFCEINLCNALGIINFVSCEKFFSIFVKTNLVLSSA